jgi:hypothetical protein
VRGFNTKARFAEWRVENETDDDIGNFLKMMSQENGFATWNHTAENHERMKRLATFDSDDKRHGTVKIMHITREKVCMRRFDFLTTNL